MHDDSRSRSDEPPVFCHLSLPTAHLNDVLAALARETLDRDFQMECSLTGGRATRKPQRFVAAEGPEGHGVVLWLTYTDTDLMRRLSARYGTVHWISADEELKTWGYLSYLSGEPGLAVLDPEKLFTAAQPDETEMRGEGPRRFSSAEAFLEHIAPHYRPVDRAWTAGRWLSPELRRRVRESGRAAIHRSVVLTVSQEGPGMELLGEWGDVERMSVEAVATVLEEDLWF